MMLLSNSDSYQRASALLIGGGGSAPETHTVQLFNRFIDLAGGPQSPIVVLTSATSSPERQRQRTSSFLARLGAENVQAPLIRNREEADDPNHAELLRSARGIYLTGGDQSRYTRILQDTLSGRALESAFAGGAAVIGGTSAGAHVMGRVMIAGSYDWIMRERGQVLVRRGLGLLSDQIVVDSHFSQRRRVPRLLSVLRRYPHLLGIGLDEDTGLAVNQDGMGEVIGAGRVYFFSRRADELRQTVLAEGGQFDLLKRERVSQRLLL